MCPIRLEAPRARADLDVVATNEAHGLARGICAARIITGTGGHVVGTLGNEVSARGDNVPARGNEVPPRENDISARGNEGTDRGDDVGKGRNKLTGFRIKVYTADNFVGGSALVLLGLPLALLGGALPRPARARCDR